MQKKRKGISVSYDDYDKLCMEFTEGLLKEKQELPSWWPTMQDVVDYIEPHFEDCYEFIIYLLETNIPAANREEKEVQRALNNLIKEKVHFYEPTKSKSEV